MSIQLNRDAASGFDQARVSQIFEHLEATPPAKQNATVSVILGGGGTDAEIVSAMTGRPLPTPRASTDDKRAGAFDAK